MNATLPSAETGHLTYLDGQSFRYLYYLNSKGEMITRNEASRIASKFYVYLSHLEKCAADCQCRTMIPGHESTLQVVHEWDDDAMECNNED